MPPAVNSEAITKADPADWDLENLTSQPFQESASNFGETEPLAQQASRVASGEPASVSNRRPEAWESRNVVARRNILLVTLIAASGLLLAGTTFFVFVRSFGKPADRIVKNPPVVEQVAPVQPLEKPAVGEPSTDPSTKEIDAETKTTQESETGQPSMPGDSEAMPPSPEQKGNDAPEKSPPLNLVPETDLANADEKPTNPQDPAQAIVEDKLPTVFEDFQRWIDAPSRGKWDDVGKSNRTIENEIALENAEVLLREEYYPSSIPIPNWAERSQRTLAAVKTKPMPLLRCIHWFSKIANTGISADWLELTLAGVDLSEPIVIEGQNTSIAELLDQICQPRGLEVEVDSAGFPRIRPTKDRLQGLIGAEGILNPDKWTDEIALQDRDVWIPLLIRMLDLTQCQYTQGRLQWTEDASLYDRARFVSALKELKRAVTKTPADANPPQDAFEFGQSEAWWMLREHVQARMPMDRIVHEEKPVIDLLSTACDQAGVQLVIDWPAAWSHGLHPSRMSLSVLRGRTLEEIANRYLEDYSLELVPLDSKTMLLTTDSVRRSIEYVVPVRLDRGMTIDDIKASIRFLVPRGADQRSRFRWEIVPGNDQIALLRICLPALVHLRDSELQRAFATQLPNTNIERE